MRFILDLGKDCGFVFEYTTNGWLVEGKEASTFEDFLNYIEKITDKAERQIVNEKFESWHRLFGPEQKKLSMLENNMILVQTEMSVLAIEIMKF